MSEWQPIETAPKDGRHFLSYTPECDTPMIIIAWSTRDKEWYTPDDKNNDSWEGATHWMSLPEPPQ